MVERLRVFSGSTEIDFSECTIEKSNDYIVDQGTLKIAADDSVVLNSVLDFRKSDGLTSVFNAGVIDKVRKTLWEITVWGNGFELNNIPVQQVYESMSPEEIVKDIIDNHTDNLTYASTVTSGFTIDSYVADGYALDVISDMMTILQWSIYIDSSNNFYFEPLGYVDNGLSYTNGTGCFFSNWSDNSRNIVNKVGFTGGFESFSHSETLSGTGTEFYTTYKPSGSMVVTGVGPSDYTVDAENKKITFTSSQTNPVVSYSYNRPIVIYDQDDTSIATYETRFKKISSSYISTFADGRKYVNSYLQLEAYPKTTLTIQLSTLDFDRVPNEIITCIDPLRSRTETLVINKVTHDGGQGYTTLTVGSKSSMFYDWQREVESRIKELESSGVNDEDKIFARNFRENLKISLSVTQVLSYSSPQNTFVLGHPTLNRLRPVSNGSSFNFEADCSNNHNNGVWYGSSIDGSQFSVSGYRLSCGVFNGSDNYVDVSNTINGVKAIMFYLNPDSTDEDVIQLTSSAKISMSSGSITTTGLSNVSIRINGVDSSSVTVSAWNLVRIEFDSINCDSIKIGYSSSYFDGSLDELFFFTDNLVDDDETLMVDKDFFDNNNDFAFSQNPVMYLSFDNPYLGLRYTTPVVI